MANETLANPIATTVTAGQNHTMNAKTYKAIFIAATAGATVAGLDAVAVPVPVTPGLVYESPDLAGAVVTIATQNAHVIEFLREI